MQIVNSFNASFLSPAIAPFQSLVAWLTNASAARPLVPPANAPPAYQRLTLPFTLAGAASRRQVVRPTSSFRVMPTSTPARTVSRLKVVREHDIAHGPAYAGRMVISGRMADVCAELDRMALRESADS